MDEIKQIVDIELNGLRKRLAERKITLELTSAAKDMLAREGFDPVYGARPLKRAMQREIVQPLAVQLLRGDFKDGDTILADVQEGRIAFRRPGSGRKGRHLDKRQQRTREGGTPCRQTSETQLNTTPPSTHPSPYSPGRRLQTSA